MEFGQGWNLPDSTYRQIVLLEYLEAESTPSTYVPLPAYAREFGSEAYNLTVADLHQFSDRGWVSLSEDMDGGCDALLRPAGRSQLEEIRAKRTNSRARRLAARDAVLHWLDDAYHSQQGTPNSADFFTTPYSQFYVQPFEVDDVDKALIWLRAEDYVEGRAAQGGVIPRPKITPKGLRVVEAGGSVNDQPQSGAGLGFTIMGDHNVVQNQSPGAMQHVVTTISDDHRQQIVGFADALEQAMPGLGLPADVAQSLPAEIKDAAQAEDPGVIATVLTKTREQLTTSAAVALAGMLIARIGDLLHLIGKA